MVEEQLSIGDVWRCFITSIRVFPSFLDVDFTILRSTFSVHCFVRDSFILCFVEIDPFVLSFICLSLCCSFYQCNCLLISFDLFTYLWVYLSSFMYIYNNFRSSVASSSVNNGRAGHNGGQRTFFNSCHNFPLIIASLPRCCHSLLSLPTAIATSLRSWATLYS